MQVIFSVKDADKQSNREFQDVVLNAKIYLRDDFQMRKTSKLNSLITFSCGSQLSTVKIKARKCIGYFITIFMKSLIIEEEKKNMKKTQKSLH